MNQAVRTALSRHTVADITFPNDFQDLAITDGKPSKMSQPGHTSTAWRPPRIVPAHSDVKRGRRA